MSDHTVHLGKDTDDRQPPHPTPDSAPQGGGEQHAFDTGSGPGRRERAGEGEHVFRTPRPIRIRVRNPVGGVGVRATDTDRTLVRVSPLRDRYRDAADRVRVELSGDAERLTVEVPSSRVNGAKLQIEIECPVGSVLDVTTATADVLCRGELGGVSASTATGDVVCDTVTGDVAVTTASADVVIGPVGGHLEVKTASGDVQVKSVAAAARATSASGDLRLGRCGADVTARTASGDIVLEHVQQGSVEANSLSGDVRVGVARGATAWLDLSTTSGSTRSDLDHDDGRAPAEGPDVSIGLRTISGDISLVRSPHPAG